MEQLFNISDRFSKSLDVIRGPERKNDLIKQVQAWISPSGARRGLVRVFAYGGIGLVFGVLFVRNGPRILEFFQRAEPIRDWGKERLAG